MLDSSTPRSAAVSHAGLQPLGSVTAVEALPAGVRLQCGEAAVRLAFLTDGILKVWLAPDGQFSDGFSYALDPDRAWSGPQMLDLDERGDSVILRTATMEVRIERSTGMLGVFTRDGRSVLEDAESPRWDEGHVSIAKQLRDGERVLGLGDKTAALDRRGGRYEHWNTDAFAFERGTDPIYKTIPFVLGITAEAAPLAYGLFVDTPTRSTFDVGAAETDRLSVAAETGELVYYVFHAPTPLEIVQDFTRLTGPMPLWPKWALGYHQCRYSYKTAEEIRAVARGFRERGIPCEALYFDIHYMDGYRVFTWDREAFPDPVGLIQELKAEGFRSVVMVDPGVKAGDPDYALAQDGLAHNAFCQTPDGEPFVGPVWPGDCYFPDFTDAEVRRWWGTWHRDLLDIGIDGVWNDMNEPAVFNADLVDEDDIEANALTFPDTVRHAYEGRGADHAFIHNAYGTQMVRATYEGLKALRPEHRPFVITRAAYAGTQRWATGWTGDNSSTWDHLRLALQQCLSLNVSGMAFVGADVGGFIGATSGELLARWTQLGALTPLFRNHSGLDTPPQEPWAFGTEVERVCREAIELRYRLLPYLYTALHESATEALPMMRALALVHPDDAFIRDDSPAGFYFGGDLLAYPVLGEGQREVEVYLPENDGGWYDFNTGEHFSERSRHRVPVDLGTLPLFARAGTVVPLGPVRASTAIPSEELTLRVFPKDGAFASTVYDDAGEGWDYEQPEGYQRVRLLGEMGVDRLAVHSEARGGYTQGPTRWRIEVMGASAPPRAVLAEEQAVDFGTKDSSILFTVRSGASFSVKF